MSKWSSGRRGTSTKSLGSLLQKKNFQDETQAEVESASKAESTAASIGKTGAYEKNANGLA
jgi:hypothetical protein